MSDLHRSTALPPLLTARRAAAAVLLCALMGVGACSSSTQPEAETTPAEVTSEGAVDNQQKKADAALNRLLDVSGKVYNSAYQNNWQRALTQFNRLQETGDRLDTLVANGTIEGIDVEAMLLQIDTLEDAITTEQQLPAMVAANTLAQTGLEAAAAIDLDATSIGVAELAYYGRELELVALGPDGESGTSPEDAETLKQAADQVIQAWDNLDAAALGATSGKLTAGTAEASEPPAASEGEPQTGEAQANESEGKPKNKANSATRVGRAVNQLRQEPNEDYAAPARRIVVGSQKILAEQNQ